MEKITHKHIHQFLYMTFVKIRNPECLSENVRKLADTAHNVPKMLARGLPAEQIREDIMERAENNGIEEMVAKMFALPPKGILSNS